MDGLAWRKKEKRITVKPRVLKSKRKMHHSNEQEKKNKNKTNNPTFPQSVRNVGAGLRLSFSPLECAV